MHRCPFLHTALFTISQLPTMKAAPLLMLLFSIYITQLQAQQTHTIYFKFNRTEVIIKDADKLKTWLSEQTFTGTIIVKGYTDTSGNEGYNQVLSHRRAKAVAKLLHYVCTNCSFQIQAFGEDSLASSTKQALNRRVEIILPLPILLKADSTPVAASKPKLDTSFATEKKLDIPALKKIYFRPDLAIIEAFSLPALTDLANALRTYPVKAIFEIRGHVNAPGSKFDKLSEDRAREIYLHMIDMGIPADHLRYRGMGNKQMAIPDPKNEKEMRKNIRVEVVVVGSLN